MFGRLSKFWFWCGIIIVASILQISPVYASVSAMQMLWSSGSNGTGNGQFKTPSGIAIGSSGDVFVIDKTNHRVQKLNNLGAYVTKLGGTTSGNINGKFKSPQGIAIDVGGTVVVADSGNHRLQKLSDNLIWTMNIGGTNSGTGDGQFNTPTGLAIDSSGNYLVVDSGNNRIQKISSDGTFISKFGSVGSGDGQFNSPTGIALDSSGNIYIADANNFRIQKFDSNGNFISKFGSSGSTSGKFNRPYGIAVDASGNIYISDLSNNRIQKVSSEGEYFMPYTGLSSPWGIAVDSSGNIYSTEQLTAASRVRKYDYSGSAYQISNVNAGLDIVETTLSFNIEVGTSNGLNSAVASVRIKDSDGLALSDVLVDLTADRNWSNVSGDSDRPSGKSYISNLIGSSGVGSTHTLYVPIPNGKTSSSVFICPSSNSLASVTNSCDGGISRISGTFVESFGTIIVSQINNLGDNVTYWKIQGMTGSGGLADNLTSFSGTGLGTADSPYQITTCSELQEMKDNRWAIYQLTNSIDCSDTVNWNSGTGFVPIGSSSGASPFTGQLIGGNNYTISNLFILATHDGNGLFGYAVGSTLSNIHLANIHYVKGNDGFDFFGGIAGYADGVTITNSSVSGVIEQTTNNFNVTQYTGGIVGMSKGFTRISNSVAAVNITLLQYSSYSAGGFVGEAQGNTLIENSHATGWVHVGYSSYDNGGFIGYQLGNTVINNCYSTGEVHVGRGASGSDGTNYDNGSFVGGMAGSTSSPGNTEINDSYSTGNFIMEGQNVSNMGGFAGKMDENSTIRRSYSTGSVTVLGTISYAIGGFVGLMRNLNSGTNPVIIDSYSTSLIDTTYDNYNIGGFAGSIILGSIDNSHSTGNIQIGHTGDELESSSTAGGFVGKITGGQVSRSYSTSNINSVGEVEYLGGFIGWLQGVTSSISQSYSVGNINGYDFLGGFVGAASLGNGNALITDSYSTGSVSVRENPWQPNIGGFISNGPVNIVNSYTVSQITSVSPSINTGGFSPSTGPTVVTTNSYWNTELIGLETSGSGTGRNSLELNNQLNFADWDFSTVWKINPLINNGFPILLWQDPELTPITTPTVTPTVTPTPVDIGMTYSDGNVLINKIDPLSSIEWVELINTTNTAINLDGWTMEFTSPNRSMVTLTSDDILPRRGLLTISFVADSDSINNTTGTITLKNSTGTIINNITYGSNGIPQATVNKIIHRQTDGGNDWNSTEIIPKGWFQSNAPSAVSIDNSLSTLNVVTNFGEEDDLTHAQNLYFEKLDKGKIQFASTLNLTDVDVVTWLTNLGNKLDMSVNGQIGLDTDIIKNFINTQATLIMYDVNFENPKILVDGEEDSGGVVSNIIYDKSAHTLTFSVAHFTTFTAVENDYSKNVSSHSAPTCNDPMPALAPDLFQIDTTNKSAKLYFTPINNTDKFVLSYSEEISAEKYGAEMILGREGVQDFTVNFLKPNTIYYFKIRGQNGCMPGKWSNVLSVKTDYKKYFRVNNQVVVSIPKKILEPTVIPTPILQITPVPTSNNPQSQALNIWQNLVKLFTGK